MSKLKYSNQQLENLDYVLEQASVFVNNNKEIVKAIYKPPLYNDEPKIFAYSAVYKTKFKHNNDIASGFAFDQKIALIRVLGEEIERYCLDHFEKQSLFTGSSEEIKSLYLDPFKIVAFSTKQLKKNSFRKFRVSKKSKFKWIKGFSLTKNHNILIPAQLVGINYTRIKDEPIILVSLSTGVAAGISLNSAIYRGICEIVERDAFMVNYLNKLNSLQVDLPSIQDKTINKILDVFNRYKLELVVLDLTTDLQIPAFAAIALDRTTLGSAVSVGLKAGFDVKATIIGAIEESLMTRSWIRDKFIYLNPKCKRKKIIRTIEDRSHFWFPVSSIKYLDFWLKNNNHKKVNGKNFITQKDSLGKAIGLLKEKNMEVIYVDITDKEIKKYGFVVVKVIIPQLHPLYLDERYPYLGGKRLYNTPVKMGILQNPKTEDDLNKIPHPFL